MARQQPAEVAWGIINDPTIINKVKFAQDKLANAELKLRSCVLEKRAKSYEADITHWRDVVLVLKESLRR